MQVQVDAKPLRVLKHQKAGRPPRTRRFRASKFCFFQHPRRKLPEAWPRKTSTKQPWPSLIFSPGLLVPGSSTSALRGLGSEVDVGFGPCRFGNLKDGKNERERCQQNIALAKGPCFVKQRREPKQHLASNGSWSHAQGSFRCPRSSPEVKFPSIWWLARFLEGVPGPMYPLTESWVRHQSKPTIKGKVIFGSMLDTLQLTVIYSLGIHSTPFGEV